MTAVSSALRRSLGAVSFGMIMLACEPAWAIDLSNNLENATGGVEHASGARRLAGGFRTDAAQHVLTSATLLVGRSAPGTATASVYTGAGLEPAVLVGTLVSPASYTTMPTPTRFTTTGISLTPNSNYWIVLSTPDGDFSWSWTTTNSGRGAGYENTWAISADGGAFWWSDDAYPVQMAVSVDEPVCIADFNADGRLDSQDFFDFLTAFLNTLPMADFNHDAMVNSQDFFDYLGAFFLGC